MYFSLARFLSFLPAPVPPLTVTTSPSRTSRVTPCSTWLSPYQPSRPVSASKVWPLAAAVGRSAVVVVSGMPRSDVGFDHFGILRDHRVVSLRQHLAAGEDGDVVGQRGHDREVVLDQDRKSVV